MEDKLKKEIAILKKLRHPNVVRLREVIDAKDSPKIFLSEFVLPRRFNVPWRDVVFIRSLRRSSHADMHHAFG